MATRWIAQRKNIASAEIFEATLLLATVILDRMNAFPFRKLPAT